MPGWRKRRNLKRCGSTVQRPLVGMVLLASWEYVEFERSPSSIDSLDVINDCIAGVHEWV